MQAALMRLLPRVVVSVSAIFTICSGSDAESICNSVQAAQSRAPADAVALLQTQIHRLRRGTGKDAEPINIVYATDSGGMRPLFNSMMSAALSADDPGRYIFHIIAPQSDLGNLTQMISVFTEELDGRRANDKVRPVVKFHELQELPFSTNQTFQPRLSGKDAAFARLFLEHYLPAEKRAIWLDTDTIIKADLSQLHDLDLRRCAVGAKPYPEIYFPFMYQEFTKSLPPHLWPRTMVRVINSGVLVVDLEKWRRDRLSESFSQLGTEIAENMPVSDQLMLNIMFHNLWKDSDNCFEELDWSWHAFSLGQPSTALSEEQYASAHILHWSGMCKPWDDVQQCPYPDGPGPKYRGLYIDFANETSFFDV
eukprot:gb/GFBE01055176.1/.p1 GENE.gb/GFBE01055176.1/~~gb/GFBE01055176.1/.p1  ORF type:complete len:366 (+),score=53.70 gb/GFBE01055176.1/:1-1098(+)